MNKGNSPSDCFPKFFKVYLPGVSGDDLELPTFFNRFFLKSFPENVTVRSVYGNRWRMDLRKYCGDTENFVLINGWKKIVRDEALTGREFLIFEFDGSNLFNFFIYDHLMSKKLRSSVQSDEIKAKSESECEEDKDEFSGDKDRASDDIISLNDDDDDAVTDNEEEEEEDVDDDNQNESNVNKMKVNISLNEDDDYDDEDDVDGDVATDKQDDDDDDYAAIDDSDDDDQDGNDDDDYAAIDDSDDDDDERTRRLKKEKMKKKTITKSPKRKLKGASRISKNDGKDDRDYLDDRMNPFFTVNQKLKRKHYVRIPAKIIKDYDLKFLDFVDFVDPLVKKFGKLKRKMDTDENGSVFVKGFESIIRRNLVKSSDKLICELRRKKNGLVREIKVHIVHG